MITHDMIMANETVLSLLVGIGAGFGLCVGPIYLSEIAPANIQGAVGTLLVSLQ